eukprot:2712562-Pyramimonas_sp.AAC.1
MRRSSRGGRRAQRHQRNIDRFANSVPKVRGPPLIAPWLRWRIRRGGPRGGKAPVGQRVEEPTLAPSQPEK